VPQSPQQVPVAEVAAAQREHVRARRLQARDVALNSDHSAPSSVDSGPRLEAPRALRHSRGRSVELGYLCEQGRLLRGKGRERSARSGAARHCRSAGLVVAPRSAGKRDSTMSRKWTTRSRSSDAS